MFVGHFATAYAAKLAALAVGHWVLDFVGHRPDMPLWPRGPRLRLGRWNSVPATSAGELAPGIEAVGGAGLIGGLLLVALAPWVDRHREPA